MKKNILSAILMSTVILSAVAPISGVNADTNSDIAKQDATISSAQSAQAQAQTQVDSIQAKIGSIQAKQADLKNKMEKLKVEGKKLNTQVSTLRQNINERNSSLQAQARSAQVNSSTTGYLDAVVNSKSLSDAIQKVTAMATVTSANKNMLDQQQKDIKSVQDKLAENQKNDGIMVAAQNDLTKQTKDLAGQEAQLKVAQLNYQLTITTAQDKKQELQAQKAAAEKAATEQANKTKAAAEAVAKANAAPIIQMPKTTASSSVSTASSEDMTVSSSSTTNVNPTTPSKNVSSTNTVTNTKSTPTPSASTPSSSSNNSSGYTIPSTHYGTNPGTYVAPTCTFYVKSVMGSRVGDYWGNGEDWAASASADGFTVDNNPVAGSTVAVFGPNVRGGSYGHVAVVESVNKAAGTMVIGEAIDLGNGYFNTTSTVKISDANYGFIHV
ncbi:coiled-coil domain-containing protein [Lactococcus lactis]|uniref:Secreted 45 kDa protein n=1 Tax=Lactococcus lactis subsp. lactis TaxID=1360 RepID=A0A2N5WF82_LACLL|nr:CHAP domain-containing protein [Lactococcus lactis]MBU5242353.1 CHAP domain-containing protein [Lactococcus lactis]PLW60895.1 Secreted 45 kDa protein [Lactococcus lactis subsp. lactis]